MIQKHIEMRLENTVALPGIIPLGKDVLGKEYEIIIEGIKGVIAFPDLPLDYIDLFDWENISDILPDKNPLPPPNANMKIANWKKTEWGYIYSSLGDAHIKNCRVWFSINEEQNNTEIANRLAILITPWLERFILFLEIMKQRIFNKADRNGKKENYYTQLWTLDEKGNMISPTNIPIHTVVQIPNRDYAINHNMIQTAIQYCNDNKQPNMAKMLLRDAYSHLLKTDYRRTILDASSGLEIALTNTIYKKLEIEIRNDDLIQGILKKYENISGRIDLCAILNIELPEKKNQYLTDIASVRNRSIHAGYQSNRIEASKAYNTSLKTVYELCLDIE